MLYETQGIASEIWGFLSSQRLPGDTATSQSPTLYSLLTGKDYESGLPSTSPSLPSLITNLTAPIVDPIKEGLPYITIGILGVAAIYLAYKFYPKNKVKKSNV